MGVFQFKRQKTSNFFSALSQFGQVGGFAILLSVQLLPPSLWALNGTPVNEEDAVSTPVVSLIYRNSNQTRIGCTGTKIGPKLVLSAAHCFDRNLPTWVGVGHTLSRSNRIKIEWMTFVKRNISPLDGLYGDLALVKTVDNIESQDGISIPEAKIGAIADLNSSIALTMIGFGYNNLESWERWADNGAPENENVLRMASFPVFSDGQTRLALGTPFNTNQSRYIDITQHPSDDLTKQFIMVRDLSQRAFGIDSGGPLLSYGKDGFFIYGVTHGPQEILSSVLKNSNETILAVSERVSHWVHYARIDIYKTWITCHSQEEGTHSLEHNCGFEKRLKSQRVAH
ncbi:MAG: hypothetical protein B7Y39_07645 [Bdellovibrio sp. 28-41-41]|nr:MAG: hypothetical protein B7Y39_07645 [Bdellovibrio sp. 28-41-41]